MKNNTKHSYKKSDISEEKYAKLRKENDIDIQISRYCSSNEGKNEEIYDLSEPLLPPYVESSFEVSDRITRKILKGFSDNDIRQILDDVNKYRGQEFEEWLEASMKVKGIAPFVDTLLQISDVRKMNADQEETVLKCVELSHQHMKSLRETERWKREPTESWGLEDLIYAMQQGIKPSEITSVDNVGWPEIIASVSRSHHEGAIQQSYKVINALGEHDIITLKSAIHDFITSSLAACIETASMARTFAISDPKHKDLESATRTRIKHVAQSGGKARSKKYKPIQEELFRLYDEGDYLGKSNNQAADIIYRKFPPNLLVDDSGDEILKDPVERFAKWLGQYKRGQFNQPT